MPTQFDSPTKQALRRRLLAWYAVHRRELPWRDSRDPYRVWLSEVMLQQTTVAAVEPYFRRFVAAFPTVAALAAADEQQVLRLWEGLGYYRRARSLHAAAKLVVEEFHGQIPNMVDELLKLPGVGRYTAGAIASIAFDQPAPILEANTVRLLSRLIAYRGDPAKSAGQKLLWAAAEDLLPRKNVADFNQALMELGALICTPTAPKCDDCPLELLCIARRKNWQNQIPAMKRKLNFIEVREAAVVLRRRGAVLMRQCDAAERYAGLWDFPRFGVTASPHDDRDSHASLQLREELIAGVRAQIGLTIIAAKRFHTLKHMVTRHRITLDCYEAVANGRIKATPKKPLRWTPLSVLDSLPLSMTGRKIAKLLTHSAKK